MASKSKLIRSRLKLQVWVKSHVSSKVSQALISLTAVIRLEVWRDGELKRGRLTPYLTEEHLVMVVFTIRTCNSLEISRTILSPNRLLLRSKQHWDKVFVTVSKCRTLLNSTTHLKRVATTSSTKLIRITKCWTSVFMEAYSLATDHSQVERQAVLFTTKPWDIAPAKGIKVVLLENQPAETNHQMSWQTLPFSTVSFSFNFIY